MSRMPDNVDAAHRRDESKERSTLEIVSVRRFEMNEINYISQWTENASYVFIQ